MFEALGKLLVVALCVNVKTPSKTTVRGPFVSVTAVIAVVPVMCTRLPVAVSRLIVAELAIAAPVAKFCAAVNVFAPKIAAVPTTPVGGKPVALVSVPDAGVPRTGVTSVGDVARTGAPVPVAAVQTGKAAPPPTSRSVVAPTPSDCSMPVAVVPVAFKANAVVPVTLPVPPLVTSTGAVKFVPAANCAINEAWAR